MTKKPSIAMPPYMASVCALATAKLRRENRLSGSIGARVRDS